MACVQAQIAADVAVPERSSRESKMRNIEPRLRRVLGPNFGLTAVRKP